MFGIGKTQQPDTNEAMFLPRFNIDVPMPESAACNKRAEQFDMAIERSVGGGQMTRFRIGSIWIEIDSECVQTVKVNGEEISAESAGT